MEHSVFTGIQLVKYHYERNPIASATLTSCDCGKNWKKKPSIQLFYLLELVISNFQVNYQRVDISPWTDWGIRNHPRNQEFMGEAAIFGGTSDYCKSHGYMHNEAWLMKIQIFCGLNRKCSKTLTAYQNLADPLQHGGWTMMNHHQACLWT